MFAAKTSVMNVHPRGHLSAFGLLLLLLVVTFLGALAGSQVLFTTDDPLGLLHQWKVALPESWRANWVPDTLVGIGVGQASFAPHSVLLWVLPLNLFANWIYAIYSLAAGMFFFLFLREKKLSSLASVFGALVYAYGSISFSLVYSGHLGKFGCFAWFAATLWALARAFNRPNAWSWRIAAGGFLGLTVSEQPDVAILFVWLFVAYLAFRVWRVPDLKFEQKAGRFVGLLALSGVISGLIAANVVLSQYRTQVQGVVEVSKEKKREAFGWATQWSYPPEETLELIAPGFFGFRVHDPTAPYWGRTGRSPEHDERKQGFARFKLDTSYLGIVPMFLAVAITVHAWRRKYAQALSPPLQIELKFWSIVAVVALLLAFGKFFLPYYLFYSIPKMNIIRNPNKFMHLFAVAIALLSAHGVHHLLERREKPLDTRWLWTILAGIAAAALLGAVTLFASHETFVAKFKPEFGDDSVAIVTAMTNSLLRLAISAGIFSGLLCCLGRADWLPRKWKDAVPYLVALLAAVDLYLTNRHYVTYYDPAPIYAANDLIRFLKADPEPHRVKILPRGFQHPFYSLYNQWLTFGFPYHRIESLDSPQTPRVPADYDQYFEWLQPNPLRFWQLTNCKYLLGPVEFYAAMHQDLIFQPHIELAHAYDLINSNRYVVTAPFPGGKASPNTQVVMRLKIALPRAKLYDRWQVIADDRRCLRTLASPEFDPLPEVIVSNPITPQTNTPPASAAPGKVEWLRRTDNVSQLRVTTDRRAVLLLNEKYDPNFVLSVDGQRAELLRCNFIMKGALIEPGTHEVGFEYRPPAIGFYVSVCAWGGCLLAVLALRLYESKARP